MFQVTKNYMETKFTKKSDNDYSQAIKVQLTEFGEPPHKIPIKKNPNLEYLQNR